MRALRLEFQPDQCSKTITYLGRNGAGLCHGICVTQYASSRVLLSPINSKNDVSSSCSINIPHDGHLLRAIAAHFIQLADMIDGSEIANG